MVEVDWWYCDSCQSFNSLSARKCYSCRKRKPKQASRASHMLGYQPVVSWDGKVSLEMRVPSVTSTKIERLPAPPKPPPLREPTRRSTLEVAPRPPQGARISYRVVEPPPFMQPPPPAGPPPRFVAVPIWSDPNVGPPAPNGVGVPPSILSSQRPYVVPPPTALGDVERREEPTPADIQHVGPWPHWRDLLDVSAPDVDRLRSASSSTALAPASGAGVGAQLGGSSLAGAMQSARSKRAGGGIAAIEWPQSDLAPLHPKSQNG
jgi:hypothetical protein